MESGACALCGNMAEAVGGALWRGRRKSRERKSILRLTYNSSEKYHISYPPKCAACIQSTRISMELDVVIVKSTSPCILYLI